MVLFSQGLLPSALAADPFHGNVVAWVGQAKTLEFVVLKHVVGRPWSFSEPGVTLFKEQGFNEWRKNMDEVYVVISTPPEHKFGSYSIHTRTYA